MKKTPISIIFLILTICFTSVCLLCHGTGWTGEWISSDPNFFNAQGDMAHTFQDAQFDANYLFVVTSDSDGLFMTDPNRKTMLWAAWIDENPNQWHDPNWQEVSFDGNAVRVDKLFRSDSDVYAGILSEGNYRIYRVIDPNLNENIPLEHDSNQQAHWRLDQGAEFLNHLYLGIYETDFGVRILRGDSPNGPINEALNLSDVHGGDPNIEISLLKHVGYRLFLGTRQNGPGAVLTSTSNGAAWEKSTNAAFDDANIPSKIVAYLSMARFMDEGWLLTEYEDTGKARWALWKTGLFLGQSPQWELQISSPDPNTPLSDPNIAGFSSLQAIGEYLYIACLGPDGGEVWKNYRGQRTEWIRVPSDPSDPFDSSNLLRDIFYNPLDINYIYAGTQNNQGARIMRRLVPRMDISQITMTDRFLGPEKDTIHMAIEPNWYDPNHWKDPNHLPDARIFSLSDPNGLNQSITPVQVDPNGISSWVMDPNIVAHEGVYHMRFQLDYSDQAERVVKYLSFAWDSNAPSIPSNVQVRIGYQGLEISWQPSTDSLQEMEGLDDANFNQSIMQYELAYWPEDDPNQVNNLVISVAYILGQPTPNVCVITNLQNYVNYEIRVRARDKADNVSGWSAVVEGMPQETKGWLDLLDSGSGCFISVLDSSKKKEARGGRMWFAGIRAGGYEPSSDEAEIVYGDDLAWLVQMELGWVHRDYLEVGLGTGYLSLDGTALLQNAFTPSIDAITFRIVPNYMTMRWFPHQEAGQVLVPYLGAGIDAWWYQEDKSRGEDRDGWRFGYHGLVGCRLLLDHFDPKHAGYLKKDFGIIHTYLTFDVVYSWIDNFGKSDLDLGGAFYQAGLMFLF